jgi:hypothetical protein
VELGPVSLVKSFSRFDYSMVNILRVTCRNIGNNFDSDIDWSQSRQYPSFDALPLLGMNTAAHIRSIFGYSAKFLK